MELSDRDLRMLALAVRKTRLDNSTPMSGPLKDWWDDLQDRLDRQYLTSLRSSAILKVEDLRV